MYALTKLGALEPDLEQYELGVPRRTDAKLAGSHCGRASLAWPDAVKTCACLVLTHFHVLSATLVVIVQCNAIQYPLTDASRTDA